MSVWRATVAVVLVCSQVAIAGGGQRQQVSRSSPTRVLSPSVVASWFAERAAPGSEQLRVLILWRGEPGWFLRGGSMSDREVAGRLHRTISYGSITLTVEYDWAQRTVAIAGKPVMLGDQNVVLVDRVDQPSGAVVTGTARIDPQLPGSGTQIGIALQPYPALVSYLRCETLGSDESRRQYLATLCLENIGIDSRSDGTGPQQR